MLQRSLSLSSVPWRTLGLPAVAVLAGACSDYKLTQFEAQDVFLQETAGQVDVLLVVDNSCSMQPYQQKLGENFDNFLTYLQEGQVDYNIGVLTTTIDVPDPYPEYGCTADIVSQIPEGGYLVGGTVIRDDTAGADSIFEDLVNVGTCGAGMEMGLESAYRALTPPISIDENIGFLRGDAMLSLIFVSDEQDASPLSTDTYINTFRELKGFEDRTAFNASALVVQDIGECSAQQVQSGASEGTRYVDVAGQTDGLLANICADDFSDILTELSLRASRLQDTWYLTKLPAPASLLVSVNDELIDCASGEWEYQLEEENGEKRGKIVFARAYLPPPDSTISVTYDYGDGNPEGFCTGESSGSAGGE